MLSQGFNHESSFHMVYMVETTRNSISSRKNVIWRFVSTLYPPFKNVMKIFCLSFSFRDKKIDSFAFLLLASIIV